MLKYRRRWRIPYTAIFLKSEQTSLANSGVNTQYPSNVAFVSIVSSEKNQKITLFKKDNPKPPNLPTIFTIIPIFAHLPPFILLLLLGNIAKLFTLLNQQIYTKNPGTSPQQLGSNLIFHPWFFRMCQQSTSTTIQSTLNTTGNFIFFGCANNFNHPGVGPIPKTTTADFKLRPPRHRKGLAKPATTRWPNTSKSSESP